MKHFHDCRRRAQLRRGNHDHLINEICFTLSLKFVDKLFRDQSAIRMRDKRYFLCQGGTCHLFNASNHCVCAVLKRDWICRDIFHIHAPVVWQCFKFLNITIENHLIHADKKCLINVYHVSFVNHISRVNTGV